MNLSRMVLIELASIMLAACNNTQPTTVTTQPTPPAAATKSTPDEFASVRGIYAKECAACHGETGAGKTVEVEGKKIKAPPLRSGHALTHTDQDFSKQIEKAATACPAFEKDESQRYQDD